MAIQNKVKNSEGQVMKAGGIVVKKNGDEVYVLMVYRGNHDDWSFPKGHNERGEDIQETVVREVKEEAGIDAEIIKELTPNKYFNPNSNEDTVCYMYLLKPTAAKIKSEHQGDKVEWVQLAEVAEKVSHPNLRKYFDSIIADVVASV